MGALPAAPRAPQPAPTAAALADAAADAADAAAAATAAAAGEGGDGGDAASAAAGGGGGLLLRDARFSSGYLGVYRLGAVGGEVMRGGVLKPRSVRIAARGRRCMRARVLAAVRRPV